MPPRNRTVSAETIETRISTGISRAQPRLSDTAMAAGLATIRDLLGLARNYQPIVIASWRPVVRDAHNGAHFIAQVKDHTGLEMREARHGRSHLHRHRPTKRPQIGA